MRNLLVQRYTKTAVIIFSIILSVITIGLYIFLSNSIRDKEFLQFASDTKPATGYISSQMNLYSNVLYGTRALFDASQSVEPNEWRQYVTALDIARNYPGVSSFFYAAKTDPHKSPLTIYPATTDSVAYPITYLEPLNEKRAKAIGFNVASDPNRLEAMNKAVLTDQPVATPMILSIVTSTPIISIYIPIYTKGGHASYEERKAATVGFATVSFKIDEIFNYFVEHMAMSDKIGLKVYDAASLFDANPSTLLFDTTQGTSSDDRLMRTDTISVAGRSWLLVYTALPGYELASFDSSLPLTILVIGLVMAILLPALLYYILEHKKLRQLQ